MADADWAKYTQIRGEALPANAVLLDRPYRLESVLKQDFYAAVGVYVGADESPADASPPARVLLKIYHTDGLGIVPLGWLGKWLYRREAGFLSELAGVAGVPQLLGRFGAAGFVREYVPGCNLREHTRKGLFVDAEFFPRLRATLADVHARGIAHNDLSKPENVLVTTDGRPVLIDFQIATRQARAGGPIVRALSRRVLRYMQEVDRYHLAKQNSRRRPMDFSPEQRQAMERKGWLITAHGWVRRPYRAVRHIVLKKFLLAEPGAAAVPAPHALDSAADRIGIAEPRPNR